jgi:hypothetical protein
MDFRDDRIFQDDRMHRVEAAVWLAEPLHVDPTKIIGAVGFDAWTGRGYQGQGSVSRRDGPSGTRQSILQIEDYATRKTKLPVLGADGGIAIIRANDGVFAFSHNAHRAAAAKLRNEALATTSLEIFEFNGNLGAS